MDKQSLVEKIDALNKTAWDIRVSDSTRCNQLSKEAIELSEPITYPRGLAEGYRTYGFSLIRYSKHQEAIDYFDKSLQLFKELNDLEGEGTVYGYQGIVQRSLGNYSQSLDLLFKFSEITIKTGNRESEAGSYYHIGATYKYLGDNERALSYLLKSLSLATEISSWIFESGSVKLIGHIYFETGEYNYAIDYTEKSLEVNKEKGDKWGEAGCLDTIGLCYFKLKEFQKAIDSCSKSLEISDAIQDKKGKGNALLHLSNIYQEMNEPAQAVDYAERSLAIRREVKDKKGEAEVLMTLGTIPGDISKVTSASSINLLNTALSLASEINANDLIAKIHWAFYENYKLNGLHEKALEHLEKHIVLSKEIHSEAIKEKIQKLEISFRAEKLKEEAESYRNRNLELAALNEKITAQKNEVEEQRKIAEKAFAELKSTQAQLIQSEKMASLGELTAGIAHEIQNPLNFVNNFSEVSNELLDEMKIEFRNGNTFDAFEIADEIKENLEKINYHGKRAEAIVKGMLQHSRTSTGQKESTDINALCDEYLRLSYHGLRAKDKTFNATFKTDFDALVGKININPQDIGRVILNLINNAFYAVSEKQKTLTGDFKPTVVVQTKKINNIVEISVKDNGNGIPVSIKDKIFQPFFTTKPTGKGTGLGLSLSYEIVKAHGGELKVETREARPDDLVGWGEETTFTITLKSEHNETD